jgi:hypothetical protein
VTAAKTRDVAHFSMAATERSGFTASTANIEMDIAFGQGAVVQGA